MEIPNPKGDVCNVKSISPAKMGTIERDFDTFNKKIFLKSEDHWFENEKLMRFFREYSEIETKFEYAAPQIRPDQFETKLMKSTGDLYNQKLL